MHLCTCLNKCDQRVSKSYSTKRQVQLVVRVEPGTFLKNNHVNNYMDLKVSKGVYVKITMNIT